MKEDERLNLKGLRVVLEWRWREIEEEEEEGREKEELKGREVVVKVRVQSSMAAKSTLAETELLLVG